MKRTPTSTPRAAAINRSRRCAGPLADHAITRGGVAAERVDTVATFTGCAFKVDRGEPLLTFVSAQAAAITPAPDVPPEKLPRVPIRGWLQGAVLRVGKG